MTKRKIIELPNIKIFKALAKVKIQKLEALHYNAKSLKYRDFITSFHTTGQMLKKNFDINADRKFRFGILCKPSFNFANFFFGAWSVGGVCVPFSSATPFPLLEKLISKMGIDGVLGENDDSNIPLLQSKGIKTMLNDEIDMKFTPEIDFPSIKFTENDQNDRDALILCTSGTSGLPKGVLYTHSAISHQIDRLRYEWKLSENDHILHMLPLNHIHGLINKFLCPLTIGAKITISEMFSAERFFNFVMNDPSINVFMAVPTIYHSICSFYKKLEITSQEAFGRRLKRFRLFISGSSSLTKNVFDDWRRISGHYLIERYGLTECGMVLSNRIDGVPVAGSVGSKMRGIDIKLHHNELMVRSKGNFKNYVGAPPPEKISDWFETGDIVKYDSIHKQYRILGRKNIDFVNVNGTKTSLLEVEKAINDFEGISESVVAVRSKLGVDYLIAFIVVEKREREVDMNELKIYLRENLKPHCVPRKFKKCLEKLQRNQMGKLDRKFFNDY